MILAGLTLARSHRHPICNGVKLKCTSVPDFRHNSCSLQLPVAGEITIRQPHLQPVVLSSTRSVDRDFLQFGKNGQQNRDERGHTLLLYLRNIACFVWNQKEGNDSQFVWILSDVSPTLLWLIGSRGRA